MKGAIISVLVVVLVLNIGLSSGLTCYVCSKVDNAGPDKDCNNATKIQPDPKECKASGTAVAMCLRTTATIKVEGADFKYVKRECFVGSGTIKEGCTALPLPGYNVTSEHCICKTNNCNGHGEIGSSPAPKISLAHFSLPVIGIALCQGFALL